MKTLSLYYSRTGITRSIMERISNAVGGELFEYTDGVDRHGVRGYIKSGADRLKDIGDVAIMGFAGQLSDYDRVIIGMPIWAGQPCVIGQKLLVQYGKQLPDKVYLVVTHMSPSPYEKAINRLDGYLEKPHAAHLSARTLKHDYLLEADVFVRSYLKHDG